MYKSCWILTIFLHFGRIKYSATCRLQWFCNTFYNHSAHAEYLPSSNINFITIWSINIFHSPIPWLSSGAHQKFISYCTSSVLCCTFRIACTRESWTNSQQTAACSVIGIFDYALCRIQSAVGDSSAGPTMNRHSPPAYLVRVEWNCTYVTNTWSLKLWKKNSPDDDRGSLYFKLSWRQGWAWPRLRLFVPLSYSPVQYPQYIISVDYTRWK